MIMGKTQVNVTSRIFDRLSIPNHRMNTGRNAIFGDGKATATNGSSSQSTVRTTRHRDPDQSAGECCEDKAAERAVKTETKVHEQ